MEFFIMNLLSGSSSSGTSSTTAGGDWTSLLWIVLLVVAVVVMMFLMSRGNKKRQQEIEEILKAIRPGNKVKTGDGVCGIIVEIDDEDNTFVLETGNEANGKSYIRFDKAAIYQTDAKPEKADEKKGSKKDGGKEDASDDKAADEKSKKNTEEGTDTDDKK